MTRVTAGLVSLVAGVAAMGMLSAADRPQTPQQQGAVLKLQQSNEYGRYLTDGDGRALYLFVADKAAQRSTCYEACARAWPPLLTNGAVKAADQGLKSDLIGTVERKDGSRQVTYGGWPLYYYVKDRSAWQTTGQDIKDFGAEWYLVSPQGKKVERSGNAVGAR